MDSRGWRFRLILAGLSVTSPLTAVESTVTSTALPKVSLDLNMGGACIWVVNALFLSSTAFQPLYGQLADVFGRRWPLISAIALFALGSGISDGANSIAMLIAGRTVQGVGLGGVNMLIDIVVCNLVPLRERAQVTAFIFIVFSHVTWRWSFYISLPIAGTAIVLMVLFLQVESKKEATLAEKMKRIDWLGNTLLVASVLAILIALRFGGTSNAWSSWHIIVPLVLANRTSLVAFIISFLHSMVMYWELYFLPVYFQGVQLSTPTLSGVQLLPTVIVTVPAAIVAGFLITKTGRYKPLQVGGLALMTLGQGLFSLLNQSSSTGAWVGFQLLVAIGSGFIVISTLPAAQASLAETDVAASTATWAFFRMFGSVWGVAIPAAIFNNQFAARIRDTGLLQQLHEEDPSIAALLQNSGDAYQ
ncbi:macrolide phosphotransferase k [Aspergillus nomiae NRRL 13137]|uniref:Macrolide phosphotransferase k n=1 Tax=Aspergillus nomiae NRRL (strain ATCC 15546 / NRRL 13137 / CBS 260.88 / M93) TaxID=1509407 RepID=A0A0L1J6J0_ASPN3|nr:macrolide phosphotransferase k [Aspergillus nomiae NRRL 13137]KNG87362.1 macrolide phosphotransferase k [Aspergillus nomiae NRRL 13137]